MSQIEIWQDHEKTEEFKAAEQKVCLAQDLTAEEGRMLYAAYVKRGLEIERLRRGLSRISNPTPSTGRPPFQADELRQMARETLGIGAWKDCGEK